MRYVHPASLAISYLLKRAGLPSVFAAEALALSNPKPLSGQLDNCDLIQVEHPWQFEYVCRKKHPDTPVVFVAHNVEAELFGDLLAGRPLLGRTLFQVIDKKERFAVSHADLVIAMSEADKNFLAERYGRDRRDIHVIPNGVDVSTFVPVAPEEKDHWKRKIGLAGKKVILFTGSSHRPNIEAIREILGFSVRVKRDDVIFLVAGSAGNAFQSQGNVVFTGYLEDISQYFRAADLAINPMVSGSGTNLKMLEYLSSGIPVITTSVGARGIEVRHGETAIICEIGDFPGWIDRLLADKAVYQRLSTGSRTLAEDLYSWENIAKAQLSIYDLLHDN